MKTYRICLAFVLLASCSRVQEVDEDLGHEAASLSATAPIAPAIAGVAAGVIAPTNGPTAPGTPIPTVADFGRGRSDIGSNLAPPAASKRSESRAGRAVPECGTGAGMKCRASSDCAANESCICRPDGGYSSCVPADCRTDADCGAGACLETLERQAGDLSCASSRVGLHCSSAGDECTPGAGSCDNAPDRACIFDTDSKRFACAPLCSEMPMMRARAD
jgi:hypothetical protein